MKRILSFVFFTVLTIGASAQENDTTVVDTVAVDKAAASFTKMVGYLSYETTLKSMPDYAVAMKNIENLSKQYDAELKSAEKEFNEKYELFLEQQAKFASAIREKRQSELQIMLERNVAFREESRRLLAQAKDDAMAPLYEKLNSVLAKIGTTSEYIIIVNTDSNSCPFINPVISEDITSIVISELQK